MIQITLSHRLWLISPLHWIVLNEGVCVVRSVRHPLIACDSACSCPKGNSKCTGSVTTKLSVTITLDGGERLLFKWCFLNEQRGKLAKVQWCFIKAVVLLMQHLCLLEADKTRSRVLLCQLNAHCFIGFKNRKKAGKNSCKGSESCGKKKKKDSRPWPSKTASIITLRLHFY